MRGRDICQEFFADPADILNFQGSINHSELGPKVTETAKAVCR